MAELYLSQDELSKAVSIYRKVVRDNPADSAATARLAELEEWSQEGDGGTTGFREHTKRVVESVPGAISCMVMGFDGLAIDSYQVGGGTLDITALLTEYSGLAAQLQRIGEEQPEVGQIRDFVVETGTLATVFRPLTEEYFLAAVVESSGLVGKARYMLRLVAADVIKEIE